MFPLPSNQHETGATEDNAQMTEGLPAVRINKAAADQSGLHVGPPSLQVQVVSCPEASHD